jgi:hypothetical protein
MPAITLCDIAPPPIPFTGAGRLLHDFDARPRDPAA